MWAKLRDSSERGNRPRAVYGRTTLPIVLGVAVRLTAAAMRARSLGPLVKTRAFGMTRSTVRRHLFAGWNGLQSLAFLLKAVARF